MPQEVPCGAQSKIGRRALSDPHGGRGDLHTRPPQSFGPVIRGATRGTLWRLLLRLGKGHLATPMANAGRGPDNPANELGIAILGLRTKREAFLRPEPTAMEEAWVPRGEVRGPALYVTRLP